MKRRWGRRNWREWDDVPPAREDPPIASGRHLTLSLPTLPSSIPLARHTVQIRFTTWGLPREAAVLDAALLIVTELVTNCVRHAAERSPQLGLTVSLGDSYLEVLVADQHPRVPRVSARGGLQVIAELVYDFGGRLVIAPSTLSAGKTVRVQLPLPAKPAP
ncbi:ATP-binding protein [Kitasatospora cathayae]|uniref:ATP-binding protein n=1 Tax=Kitasatospora cathayae TaxID=3004092 RepID=A0ABY7PY63_9ACTN|nr:ATP-binding protein [Kitasatospora sp. HUAS 3-15]WBP85336.1 ATP-binding protein [Kitasatospora sp. HUAS 3-15]